MERCSYKKTNNFTNIEKSNDNWLGKVKNGSSERFESFEKPEYGARAAIKDLRTKVKSGYDTIAKAITRHAPPSDNNPTDKYIENVSKWTGIDPNQKLTESDLSTLVSDEVNTNTFEIKERQWKLFEEKFNLLKEDCSAILKLILQKTPYESIFKKLNFMNIIE